MASATADDAPRRRRPYAFHGGPVARLADLDLDPDDDTTQDRLDGPAAVDPGPSPPNKTRDTTGEPLKLSFNQLAEFVGSCDALWQLHADLTAVLSPARRRPGRPVGYEIIDILLFMLMAWACMSVRGAQNELRDKRNWDRIRDTVAAARAAWPAQRLSKRPPTREQYMRLRNKLAARADFEDWLDRIDDICVQLAVRVGLFDPGASITNPPITSDLRGDGSWLRALWKSRKDQAFDPDTGDQIRRYDPEALQYTRNNAGSRLRQAGHHYVALTAHGSIRGVRVPLSTRLLARSTADNPQGECTLAMKMTKRVKERIDKHGGEVRSITFDGAMHPPHRDEALDMGIIPVSTVQRKAGDAYAERVLGPHHLTLADGTKEQRTAYAIDGGLAIGHRAANGDEILIELERHKTVVEPGIKRSLVRGYFRVPRDRTVPKRLWGATIAIRHNSTKEEIDNDYRRTRALDVFPPKDPVRKKHHGARQDVESYNSDFKRSLINGRARTVTQNRLLLELAGFNLYKALRALAYHMRHHGQRTDSDWLGAYELPQDI